MLLGIYGWIVFLVLFGVFVFLGFYGSRWRRADLSTLHEWALAGRRLGILLAWFLIGADLYTAYTFIAVPELAYTSGGLAFFAIPYVAITFPIALLTMSRLWTVSRNKGYVTAADFVRDRFNSGTLAILIALTGVVAELPYIALQIVGMEAALDVMLYGYFSSIHLVSEISLIIAFIILAAFTFTSGLRGATLTAIFKDAVIYSSLIILLAVVFLTNPHAFSQALASDPKALTLPPVASSAFLSLAIGSAIALYLYPHAVNGSLSADSRQNLRWATSLLPLYGVGLAFITLLGILIYAFPSALNVIKLFGSSGALLVVPTLVVQELPAPVAGFALLGIFIGGLVPAAIMAIASANLLTRNVVKEFKRDMSPKGEATLSKWLSAVIKFIALAFVFAISAEFSIELQLLGGIIILQTTPAVFLGLYTKWFNKYGLIAGWVAGMFSGVYLTLVANHFGLLKSSTYAIPGIGPVYIGLTSLAINVVVAIVGTLMAIALGYKTQSEVKEEELQKLM
ncbi:sodium:solute symporter [Sulfolobales archaeon HS-7]|nr:sodium:solute symporter [Sulfolobales archaeon HS-7]